MIKKKKIAKKASKASECGIKSNEIYTDCKTTVCCMWTKYV